MMASLLLQRFVRPPDRVGELPNEAPEIIRIARTIGPAFRRGGTGTSAGEPHK
jgi:hypothetical protein